MVGGLAGGIQGTSAARHSELLARQSQFLAKHALMVALVIAVAVLYRVSGVAGTALGGESGFALAALIPVATIYRTGIFKLRVAAPQEQKVPALVPELSLR